jgi:hypothetical protein
MARWLMLLGMVLLLGACRYTFVPLAPERVNFPDRASVNGTLEAVSKGAIVKLTVRRMPEPGYMELRWYKEDQLFQEKSIWVEKAGQFEARFDRIDEGYYRLIVLIKNSPMLQLEVGTPLLPTPPQMPPPNP